MLEYFCASLLAEHLENKKEKEDKKYEKFYVETQLPVMKMSGSNLQGMNLVVGMIALVIAMLTARLAYECNVKSSPALRILASIFGFFFSSVYLLYYFLRYVLFNGKC